MIQGLSMSDFAVFFISLVVAMSTHEAMHGFMARWLGDDTAHYAGRLTLNPLKHIDFMTTILLPLLLYVMGLPLFLAAKPVPFNPERLKYEEFGAALVGLAGPLTNLALAIVTAAYMRVAGVAVGTEMFNLLGLFVSVNIALFVFNMIPFPPLDGSRVLYAFAPEPLQNVMRQIESLGFNAIVIFMIIFFLFLSPLVLNIDQFLLRLLLG